MHSLTGSGLARSLHSGLLSSRSESRHIHYLSPAKANVTPCHIFSPGPHLDSLKQTVIDFFESPPYLMIVSHPIYMMNCDAVNTFFSNSFVMIGLPEGIKTFYLAGR